MPLKMLPEWAHEGLRFECTECGECCTGAPGYIWVSKNEVIAIAEHLNISLEKFGQQYLRQVGKRWSLLEDPKNFDCIFLKDNKCQIYPVRPMQCKTFPWWLQNLTSEESWQQAAKTCEGIGRGEVVPSEVIEECLINQLKENNFS